MKYSALSNEVLTSVPSCLKRAWADAWILARQVDDRGRQRLVIWSRYGLVSRPLYIEITERDGGVFAMQWRTPASVPRFNIPEIALTVCEAASPVGTTRGPGGPVSQWLYRCGEGLAGAALEIRYAPGYPHA